MKLSKQANYISEIKQILAQARQKAYSAVNAAMVEAYWLVGKRIVEEEQHGKDRAGYGKEILKTLSIELNAEFEKGFSITNLQNFRKFYLLFSDGVIEQTSSVISPDQIQQTVSVKSELEKDHIIAKYSVLNHSQQLFATKYMAYLPTEEELVAEIEREKLILKQQFGL